MYIAQSYSETVETKSAKFCHFYKSNLQTILRHLGMHRFVGANNFRHVQAKSDRNLAIKLCLQGNISKVLNGM